MSEEAWNALHRYWTKAVGTEGYVKAEPLTQWYAPHGLPRWR